MCKNNGIKIIDMTPAKQGICCCPIVNIDDCMKSDNINMISCGGQASIPICYAFKEANPKLEYIEIVSTISSASAGPGTRKNISEYITSTQEAVATMLGIKKVKVIINITPAVPPIKMKTTVLANSGEISDKQQTKRQIEEIVASTKNYVPGYETTVTLEELGKKMMCQVEVSRVDTTYQHTLEILISLIVQH